MSDLKENSKSTSILLISVAILSLVVGVWVSQKLFTASAAVPKNLEATLLDKSKPLTNFNLIDHDNAQFNLTSLHNNWSFLFFG